MATLLAITNKVLKRLREDTVADLTDPYAALIASYVADIAAEVGESFAWEVFNDWHTTTLTSAGEYTLAAGTGYGLIPNNKSTLLFMPNGQPQCWLYDGLSDNTGQVLTYVDPTEMQRLRSADWGSRAASPTWFTIEPEADGDTVRLVIHPYPNAAAVGKLVDLRLNTPQPELDPATDANTDLILPERLLRLGALYLALNERGEEVGEAGSIAERRYLNALAAAIENEIRARERTGVYDWRRG